MKSFLNETWPTTSSSHVQIVVTTQESRVSYLRPNRYFRFYLFREKEGERTCWVPDGFCS